MPKLAPPPSTTHHSPVDAFVAGEPSRESLLEKRKAAREKAEKRGQTRTVAKRQQAAERISSATEELASGITEASNASNEIYKAMGQISEGAAQAASAAQQSQRVAVELAKASQGNSAAATQSLRKVDAIQELVRLTTSDIDRLVQNVGSASDKNVESAKMIADLEKQANEIGEVVKTVAGIADQTNLLALNAAIEAARAGEHGRGFAVVADEVRNLAEVAEKSAREIRELIANIQKEVNTVAQDTERAGTTGRGEVEKGKAITAQLLKIEQDLVLVQKGASVINDRSTEMAAGVEQFRKGADVIGVAAEEASSAAMEATSAANEQMKGLKEIEASTDELAQMAEELKMNTDSEKSSAALAAAAEELSATIEQANAASQQIMAAIAQIAKGAEQQASATEESSAALRQIEGGVADISDKAGVSLESINVLQSLLAQNKVSVDELIEGVKRAADASRFSGQNVQNLVQRIRAIDKIVDAISNVAMMTNMLAVNGGIEAARAGDFGKGFAVVASDIRSLATDSAANAEKIKDMVRNIQDTITVVARDIIEVGEAAGREAENAKKSTSALIQVEGDMNEVRGGVLAIAKNAEVAVSGVKEALKGVEQISAAAQQSSSASQQAAASAQEQARGMQELARAIEDIAALADELQN